MSRAEKSSLSELTIRSLGVIESTELEFGEGLTVITGETGAGKTMILTALNLILGAKSDTDFIRTGDERLVVSGKFKLGAELTTSIEEIGGVVEESAVIINRSITIQGKSKITLGGVASTTSQVSDFAQELIEIHAQASSARLSKPVVQRELLDSFGDHQQFLENYGELFSEFTLIRKRIAELEMQISQREMQMAKLEGFVSDFAKVAPKRDELIGLENEINKLGSVEELNTGLIGGLTAISGEDSSAMSALNLSKKILESLRGKDVELDSLIDRFTELVYEINESNSGLERYLARLEADPVRFDQLQNRKSELLLFLKKYGKEKERESALDNLITEASEAESKLMDLKGGDSRLEELNSSLVKLFKELQLAGKRLTEARENSASKLSTAITEELAGLAMPNAKLSVEITTAINTSQNNFTQSGLDEVLFLFTSHTEGKLLPLSKAASGGELSRVMLAIEVVLAKNSPVGTYIFDEVDAGVGGKSAIEVGRRLALLAKNSQVIVVSHLAQVASWADKHLVVTKSENGSVTQSNVKEVSGAERRREVARLLSGQEDSTTAQEHAGELLDLVATARAEMIG
jgi:DNA repair protein RecN (Recombination protein N)